MQVPKVAGGGFLVSRCDGTAFLEAGSSVLDTVAATVGVSVVVCGRARAVGGQAGLRARRLDHASPEARGVGLVADDPGGRTDPDHSGEQGGRGAHLRGLPAEQDEGQGQDEAEASLEERRGRKKAWTSEGWAHASAILDGEDCLGWCQFGPPKELPRIHSA